MDPFSQFLDHAFGLTTEPRDFTLLQISVRGLFVFASALVMLRVAHKRFFARRNALDVLLTLVIASTLARAINGSAAYFPTLFVGFVLVLTHRALSYVSARMPVVGRMVKGGSCVLIDDGKVRGAALREHDLSSDDLDEDLRLNGIETPREARRAILERNGEVSVIKAE